MATVSTAQTWLHWQLSATKHGHVNQSKCPGKGAICHRRAPHGPHTRRNELPRCVTLENRGLSLHGLVRVKSFWGGWGGEGGGEREGRSSLQREHRRLPGNDMHEEEPQSGTRRAETAGQGKERGRSRRVTRPSLNSPHTTTPLCPLIIMIICAPWLHQMQQVQTRTEPPCGWARGISNDLLYKLAPQTCI
jgi:hypothetical protein